MMADLIITTVLAGVGVGQATGNGWWGLAASAFTYAIYRKA